MTASGRKGLRAALVTLLEDGGGGVTARTLAQRLRKSGWVDSDKATVNSVLYRGQGSHFQKDDSVPPRWYIASAVVPLTEEARPNLGALVFNDWKSLAGLNTLLLGDITLLFGANSSGKTSILQTLLMLKQSMDANSFVYEGEFASCDNLLNVVHRHEPDRAVTLGAVLVSGSEEPEVFRYLRASKWHGGTDEECADAVTLSVNDKWMNFRYLEHGDDGDPCWWLASTETGTGFADQLGVAWPDPPNGTVDYFFKDVDTGWPGDLFSVGVNEEWVPTPTRLRRAWSDYSTQRRRMVRDILFRVEHLGPMREVPGRWVNAAESGDEDLGSDVIRRLKNPELQADVNDWLERLEIPYSVAILSEVRDDEMLDSLVLTRRGEAGERVRLQDVGYGIGQVLPLVVLAVGGRDRIILVEQPEVHLHPRLQSRLADLLVTSAQDHNNQLLVETHSEHLLLRLQRRVAEGRLDYQHLRAYYVDRVGPRAEIETIAIDEQGQMVDGWPAGFFDDRLDDLLAIADPEEDE